MADCPAPLAIWINIEYPTKVYMSHISKIFLAPNVIPGFMTPGELIQKKHNFALIE